MSTCESIVRKEGQKMDHHEDVNHYGEMGHHRGMRHHWRHRRGRPAKAPWIKIPWNPTEPHYKLELYDFELEVLRLVDLEGLTQEEAAQEMKPENDSLSRGNINRYLQNAREKVVKALLQSETIEIEVINTQKKEDKENEERSLGTDN